jgi:hypothetical protein
MVNIRALWEWMAICKETNGLPICLNDVEIAALKS